LYELMAVLHGGTVLQLSAHQAQPVLQSTR